MDTHNCWELVVFCNLFSLVSVQTIIESPSPINLTLSWKNEFCLELSWRLPENVDENLECEYNIHSSQMDEESVSDMLFETCVSLERGVTVSVRSDCNNKKSHPVVHTIAAPRELVKDFHCFYYSSNALNCSWLPTNQSPEDIHFYYGYPNGSRNVLTHTSVCRHYLYSAGEKTGCLIKEDFDRIIVYLQVNGTVNGSSVRNTFKVIPKYNVKPPAPNVTITETGPNLLLSWNHPLLSVSDCWDYILNYSKCGELQSLPLTSSTETSYHVTIPYDPRCQYRVQVKAIYSICGIGESDWSEVKIYGEDEWVITAISIVIPATVFLFVMLFLWCLMKHRNTIFPKIPRPSITDTLNSSMKQKTFKENLYVPVEKDVECKINLRNEPQRPMMQPD